MSPEESSHEAKSAIAMNASQLGDRMERWSGLAWRFFAAAVGLMLMTLLAIAWTLEPSQSGLGTHQKLGLPPCSVRVLFGIRCPSCGMTTSWAHFMDGNLSQSLRSNAGGFLLALYSLCVIPIAIRYAWSGRDVKQSILRWGVYCIVAIAVITCAQWLWVLYQGA